MNGSKLSKIGQHCLIFQNGQTCSKISTWNIESTAAATPTTPTTTTPSLFPPSTAHRAKMEHLVNV